MHNLYATKNTTKDTRSVDADNLNHQCKHLLGDKSRGEHGPGAHPFRTNPYLDCNFYLLY